MQQTQIQNLPDQTQANAPRGNIDQLEPNTLIIEDEALRKGFTSTPNYILEDTDVALAARFTYILLLSFAWQEGSCFPGQARLAVKLGVTRQMVNRYLNELKEKKYITWQRRGLGKTNVYHILKVKPSPPQADVNYALHQDVKSGSHQDVNPALHKEYSVEKDTVEEYSDNSKLRMLKIFGNREANRRNVRQKVGNRAFNQKTGDSKIVVTIIRDLTNHFLNDPLHVKSNITRAKNALSKSGLSEEEFILLMREAKKITFDHYGSIRKKAGYLGLKNQAPYFFEVLENLIKENLFKQSRRRLVEQKYPRG